jgi:hypothetical protein
MAMNRKLNPDVEAKSFAADASLPASASTSAARSANSVAM